MAVLMYLSFFLDLVKLVYFAVNFFLAKLYRFFVPNEPKSLKGGEIILVTGGANGIGREICRELVLEEAAITIIIWDIDEANIDAVVKELEANAVKKAVGFKVDVSNREEVKAAAIQIRKEIGDVTMLFNNAGIIGETGEGWTMSPESIEKVFGVNMTSHCWTLQEFLPAMIAKGKGHVIETCSVLGYTYVAGGSPYIATKHGLNAYAECIKEDLRQLPQKPEVKFTTVYPHFTSTAMMDRMKLRSGKYPFLIPNYTPRDVAQRTLEGVLLNEEHIYFPGYYRFMPMIVNMVPPQIYRRFIDIIDLESAED